MVRKFTDTPSRAFKDTTSREWVPDGGIVPFSATHSLTDSTPALPYMVFVASASHGHSATSPTFNQSNYSLAAVGAFNAHTAAVPSMVQKHGVVGRFADHSHTASSPTLSELSLSDIVSVASASNYHSASAPSLTGKHHITVAQATNAHRANSPALYASPFTSIGPVRRPSITASPIKGRSIGAGAGRSISAG